MRTYTLAQQAKLAYAGMVRQPVTSPMRHYYRRALQRALQRAECAGLVEHIEIRGVSH